MDQRRYMDYISKFATATRLLCIHCGAETPSLGQFSLCSACENIVDTTADAAAKTPAMADSIRQIKALVDSGNFDAAIAAYKGIDPTMEEPALLYALALLYIRYSNSVLGGVNYTKQGFMYENIDMRDRSLALISLSKRMLARAIVLLTASLAKGEEYRQRYLLLLCQIKFGKIRGASESIEALKKSSQPALASYASLLLDAKSGEMEPMRAAIEEMERSGNIFVNTLFYDAYLDLKERKADSARMKLAALSAYSESQSIEALMEEIKEALDPQ
ncbi:MAG: hypothetical protein KGH58_03935 [Candidatus Micrarchaeota archaeon]|nr:hypothetical protein [Candidatus Micrarchaeota archaeon]MDE1833541.1 hypothetical protein [Candidatus Micrarchaeota archaeon]